MIIDRGVVPLQKGGRDVSSESEGRGEGTKGRGKRGGRERNKKKRKSEVRMPKICMKNLSGLASCSISPSLMGSPLR